MQFIKPMPFEEAVDKLGERSVIGAQLNSAEWARVPVALRERAFFSSQVENVKFLQRGQDAINDFLTGAREDTAGGPALKLGSRAEFISQMREFALAEGMGPLVPEDAGTLKDITSERRLGLIFDVQTQAANDYGSWKQGMDADVLDEFPAQRFIREKDVTTPRPHHAEHDGEVHLKTDLDFWLAMNSPEYGGFGVPWGPWGFNSGMAVEDVDREEAEDLGLLTPGQQVEPVERDFNDHLKASVTGLDPALIDRLKTSLGDQVMFQGGSVWWKGDRAGKRLAGVEPRRKAVPEMGKSDGPAAFPSAVDNLTVVRRLGGSTGAELVRDPKSGAEFVRKRGSSAAHVREEHAANELYRALGVPVPEGRIYEGGDGPVQLTRFVEGRTLGAYLKDATPEQAAAVKAKVAEHFAADALLGNWDVAGLNLDNILVTADGTPVRIDNGGALRFRAQGKAKTDAEWNAYPTELWSLRDRTANPQTAEIFGGLDFYQVARQIEGVNGEALLAAAPPELRDVLAARLRNLKDVGRKAREFEATNYVPGHASEVTRHMLGLRQAETFANLADELKQSGAGQTTLYDADGNAFDGLRTQGAKAMQADPSQKLYDDFLAAAKTINAHHDKGDTVYNLGKVNAAELLKGHLEGLVKNGTAAEQAMGAHYLKTLADIAAAKGNQKAKVATVTKFALAQEPAKLGESVTAQIAGYINANGGNWEIIAQWAGAQGGSSASAASEAASHFLLQRLRGIDPAELWNQPSEAAHRSLKKLWGDQYEKTWEMWLAAVQEVLGRTSFPGNDVAAGLVRILRTETSKSSVPFKKGKTGRYARRVNASGSVFAPVFGGARTITRVPHTRVTGLYFFERNPGSATTFFYGDHENEFTYVGPGLDAYHAGWNTQVNLQPGNDSSTWEP
jgi:hypothetical protein